MTEQKKPYKNSYNTTWYSDTHMPTSNWRIPISLALSHPISSSQQNYERACISKLTDLQVVPDENGGVLAAAGSDDDPVQLSPQALTDVVITSAAASFSAYTNQSRALKSTTRI